MKTTLIVQAAQNLLSGRRAGSNVLPATGAFGDLVGFEEAVPGRVGSAKTQTMGLERFRTSGNGIRS